MITDSYKVLGVMSGTSLDGLDIAYIDFQKNSNWNFKILVSETYEYSEKWKRILSKLIQVSQDDLGLIDLDYTNYLVDMINKFIIKNNISEIDAICSHGHTAFHQPEKGITIQIGNRKELAQKLQKTVVCDFRPQDVELGGQGAPLVPVGDELLFNEYDFCLNLGGFANVSFDEKGSRYAFDICPVNVVLNHYCQFLGKDYDDRGMIAASGSIQRRLLKQLNDLEFYKKPYPKSLGFEWVKQEVFPVIDSYSIETKDILRTAVEHFAIQISEVLNTKNNASVLVTGGGAYHELLIHAIQELTQNRIIIPDKSIIEFKEALVFGLLGVLRLRGDVNCLSSVTGAKYDHSSGKIWKK